MYCTITRDLPVKQSVAKVALLYQSTEHQLEGAARAAQPACFEQFGPQERLYMA